MMGKKRKILPIVLTGLTSIPASADSIAGRMTGYEFSGFGYIDYYLKIWLNGFVDYPWVVRVSVLILLACMCSVLFLTVRLIVDKIIDIRRRRFRSKLWKKYRDVLCDIFVTKERLDDIDIKNRAGLTESETKKWKGWKMFEVGNLFIDVKAEKYDVYRQENVIAAARVFGLQSFLESSTTFGSAKVRIKSLRVALFLMLDLPESILVRLLNSRSYTMRKEVRMYYLWLSDYAPFRFFTDPKMNYEFRLWDALEVHHLLRARRKAGKEIPSLVPVVNECPDAQMKACLIREVAYWGSGDEIKSMESYLSSPTSLFRLAAIQCMGIARCKEGEDKLQAVYAQQSESLRVAICETMSRIGSGRAVPFFVECYENSEVQQTKFHILRCLVNYNSQGRREFERLEQKANSRDEVIFRQVRAFTFNNDKKLA